ncbi:TIGR02300 family protein [Corallococcus praedator]|uniref:TIGR02300 family protein n=1 Tax=Corallococcus praedator TaxID=2316724 RepID=A0ABX9Q3R9_9BACT|nr:MULTISPECIES: TIGR02300 family protein [Corallococcus]RKG96143.1 TIGR02300 family protein [Corallococcus sp. CA047B]RKH16198.1 TIGR02300 family protein [Corallococcus sp. CA031C]RKH87723.1 TIGR02300 family protein [Corallococcus praedator]
MAAKDLGNKHVCFKCASKFYDLKKPDAICPKCGADQKDAPAPKPEGKRGRLAATPKIIEPEPEETPAAEEDEDGIEAFEDEDAETPGEPAEDEEI